MKINKGINTLDRSWHLIPSILIEICDYGFGSTYLVFDLLIWKWSLFIEIEVSKQS